MERSLQVLASDRELLICLLVDLLKGSVSYSDFTNTDFSKSDDRTAALIWSELEEMLQDDLYPYRPVALSREVRDVILRSILFLRSGCSYEWPRSPMPSRNISLAIPMCFVAGIILVLATRSPATAVYSVLFAVIFMVIRKIQIANHQGKLDRWREHGDIEVWPFRRRHEYEQIGLHI